MFRGRRPLVDCNFTRFFIVEMLGNFSFLPEKKFSIKILEKVFANDQENTAKIPHKTTKNLNDPHTPPFLKSY